MTDASREDEPGPGGAYIPRDSGAESVQEVAKMMARMARMIAEMRRDMDARLDQHRETLSQEFRAELKHESEVIRADVADSLAYLMGEQTGDERKAAGDVRGGDVPVGEVPRPPTANCHRRGRYWVIPVLVAVVGAVWRWIDAHRVTAVSSLAAAATTSAAVWVPMQMVPDVEPAPSQVHVSQAPHRHHRPAATPALTGASRTNTVHRAHRHHKAATRPARPASTRPSSVQSPAHTDGGNTARTSPSAAPSVPSPVPSSTDASLAACTTRRLVRHVLCSLGGGS